MLFPKWNVASWEKEQLEGKTFLNLNKLHSISFFFLWNEKSFYVFCVRNWKSQLQRVWDGKFHFHFRFGAGFLWKLIPFTLLHTLGCVFWGFFLSIAVSWVIRLFVHRTEITNHIENVKTHREKFLLSLFFHFRQKFFNLRQVTSRLGELLRSQNIYLAHLYDIILLFLTSINFLRIFFFGKICISKKPLCGRQTIAISTFELFNLVSMQIFSPNK